MRPRFQAFTGIEVRTGSPLVLFAESDDHFPVAEGRFHSYPASGWANDVTEYFSDADGDELVYSVTSNDDHLVGTRVGVITLIPRAEGYTSLVVTATDSNGWSASQALAITVLPTPNPRSFDIDLVFVGPVTADTRSAALQMPNAGPKSLRPAGCSRTRQSVQCLPVEQRFFGTIDDLVVFVAVSPSRVLPWRFVLARWFLALYGVFTGYGVGGLGWRSLARVILHEIHALGFLLWHIPAFTG